MGFRIHYKFDMGILNAKFDGILFDLWVLEEIEFKSRIFSNETIFSFLF